MKKVFYVLSLCACVLSLDSCKKLTSEPQLFPSEINGKLGMVNLKGENVIPYQFDGLYMFDLAPIK